MADNRIAKAAASLWHYPLAGATGGSGITAVDVIVVDLETADGVTGTGFSYVLGGSGAIVAAQAADLVDRFVSGHDLSAPAALWRRLAASLNRLGRGPGYLAIAAIDVAAWDLHAKRMGVPPSAVNAALFRFMAAEDLDRLRLRKMPCGRHCTMLVKDAARSSSGCPDSRRTSSG